jgi:uncharacterized protein (UPF0335 family)
MMPKNSIEGRAEPFVRRVESLMDELATLRGRYMAECKAVRGEIKDVYKDAKDEEVPVKPLKALIRYRELERKQNEIAAGLDDMTDLADYQTLVEALGEFGDTPLGQAALDLAGGGGDDDDEGDQRPRFVQTQDQPPTKPKRTRRPRSPAAEHARALGGESDEEREALDEIDKKGIGGAAASFETRP